MLSFLFERIKKMRVLVLAAHPDDEVLGAGATIAKLAHAGHEIKIVTFTDGVGARGETNGRQISLQRSSQILGAKGCRAYDFPDNRMDAVPLLDIIKVAECEIEEWNPRIIFTHSRQCLNVDHRRVFEASLVATRMSHAKIMSYEVLSSSEWNYGSPFRPNCYVDVTGYESFKISAMRDAYGDELRGNSHPRNLDTILDQMRVNGSACCVSYAERFEIIKEVL